MWIYVSLCVFMWIYVNLCEFTWIYCMDCAAVRQWGSMQRCSSVRQCGSVWHQCDREFVAVRTVVRAQYAWQCAAIWQCGSVRQCAAVFGSVRQCDWQSVAVRNIICAQWCAWQCAAVHCKTVCTAVCGCGEFIWIYANHKQELFICIYINLLESYNICGSSAPVCAFNMN
jgi:hypothetical protein